MKPSELFEGEDSSLRKTFDEAVSTSPQCKNCQDIKPGQIITMTLDNKCDKCGQDIAMPIKVSTSPKEGKELSPIKDKIQQIFNFLEHADVTQWQGMNVFEAGDADSLYGILETAFSQIAQEEREATRMRYLLAFGNYVPLSGNDVEPEVMAKAVTDIWGEKSKEEERNRIVKILEGMKSYETPNELHGYPKLIGYNRAISDAISKITSEERE